MANGPCGVLAAIQACCLAMALEAKQELAVTKELRLRHGILGRFHGFLVYFGRCSVCFRVFSMAFLRFVEAVSAMLLRCGGDQVALARWLGSELRDIEVSEVPKGQVAGEIAKMTLATTFSQGFSMIFNDLS